MQNVGLYFIINHEYRITFAYFVLFPLYKSGALDQRRTFTKLSPLNSKMNSNACLTELEFD